MHAILVPATLLLPALWKSAVAHEHHGENIPDGAAISPDPIDTVLWIHILLQLVAWGFLFPTGMVLGLVRSRWHVPVQTLGVVLAIVGYFLGHKHKGRQFAPNAHAAFANWISFLLAAQVIFGIYLKLHLEKGILGRVRRGVVFAHGLVGPALPVFSWAQMLLGGVAAVGFCRGDHLRQCVAHFTVGSALVGYGTITAILLFVGQTWLRRTGRSQEFFDSLVITLWGCVNTFVNLRKDRPWNANELFDIAMGITWWSAGLFGVWLSRRPNGAPQRNLVPALTIMLTGWAMAAQPRHPPLSAKAYAVFGYSLIAAGVARTVEISFVLRDRLSLSASQPEGRSSFQLLTPVFLMTSGFLFMGSTDEQMESLSKAGVTHVSSTLVISCISFVFFLFVSFLLHIYAQHAWPVSGAFEAQRANTGSVVLRDDPTEPGTSGQSRPSRSAGRLLHAAVLSQGAEEFELEGLISEDENSDRGIDGSSEPSEDSGTGRRKEARS